MVNKPETEGVKEAIGKPPCRVRRRETPCNTSAALKGRKPQPFTAPIVKPEIKYFWKKG